MVSPSFFSATILTFALIDLLLFVSMSASLPEFRLAVKIYSVPSAAVTEYAGFEVAVQV